MKRSFWLELLAESGTVPQDRLESLRKEADELLAIIVASIKSKKRNKS